jgi:hypothetical protein
MEAVVVVVIQTTSALVQVLSVVLVSTDPCAACVGAEGYSCVNVLFPGRYISIIHKYVLQLLFLNMTIHMLFAMADNVLFQEYLYNIQVFVYTLFSNYICLYILL